MKCIVCGWEDDSDDEFDDTGRLCIGCCQSATVEEIEQALNKEVELR